MKATLKNDSVWKEFAEIVAQIDVDALAKEHLEDCNYTVSGYWDENELYEEITFIGSLYTELVSSSLGITVGDSDNSHWIKLKFLLKADTSVISGQPVSDIEKRIGELILIFDSNLEFIDEN